MQMAKVYEHERYQVGTVPIQSVEGHVSWGGVWSGFLIGIGLLLLFSALGLAIGISTIGVAPGEELNARGLGVGAVIWSSLSILVALFIGGIVSTRVGGIFDRTAGMIQGALVWVLALLGILYLAGSGVGILASGAFGMMGGLTRGAGAVAGSTPQLRDLASGDMDQILARLNDPQTVKIVATATGMSQEEARSNLASIRARVEAVKDDPAKAVAEAKQGLQDLLSKAGTQVRGAAAAAQPYASSAIWITFAAMLFALLASVGGAMIGRSKAAISRA
jgi:hypothetical protein